MGGLGSWFQTMWFQTMYIRQQCGDVRMQMVSRAGHRGKMDTGGTVHWARGWWFEGHADAGLAWGGDKGHVGWVVSSQWSRMTARSGCGERIL